MKNIFIVLLLLLTNISLFSMHSSSVEEDRVKRSSIIIFYDQAIKNEKDLPLSYKNEVNSVQEIRREDIIVDINDGHVHQAVPTQIQSRSSVTKILKKLLTAVTMENTKKICKCTCCDVELEGLLGVIFCTLSISSMVCICACITLVAVLVNIGLITWAIA